MSKRGVTLSPMGRTRPAAAPKPLVVSDVRSTARTSTMPGHSAVMSSGVIRREPGHVVRDFREEKK